VLVVDDTALPKQGKLSVGVARQYCGALGKRANCQVLVSLTLARGEVRCQLGCACSYPRRGPATPGAAPGRACPRCTAAPRRRPTSRSPKSTGWVIAAGARFGRVLADAGYGMSAAFRRGLGERGLAWAAGIPKVQNVYPTTVELLWPTAGTGRPRKHPVPSEDPVAAETALANAEWRRVAWRRGTMIGRADHPPQPGRRRQRLRGGPLAAEFAASRVRPAEGDQLRNGRHPPGAEVWLVGERRASGERMYYLSNLPVDAPLEELAAAIKARWVCEQGHQQLKEEFGLDHFEGRSWTGLHRHA
jgi:SRSO17 transposase